MEEDLVLENYGVKLKLLTHDKIEQLRQWRNDPKIQQFMFYRQEITPEMQERWYSNLDKKSNYYFFIEYERKEIGVINIKDIDWHIKQGEPGLFVYDDNYLNTDVALRAVFCMYDWVWNVLSLNSQIIEVDRDNKRAVKFNIMLGYKELPPQDGDPDNKIRMIIYKQDALVPNKLLDRLKRIFNK